MLSTESTHYDRAGNVIATVDPRGTTNTFSYDATGALVEQVQPISASDEIVTSFGYDLAGNRTRFTDGRGNRFVTTYNAWGLVESQIEPATAAYPGRQSLVGASEQETSRLAIGYFARAMELGRKLGPVLYQLPQQLPKNVERLAAFLAVMCFELHETLQPSPR